MSDKRTFGIAPPGIDVRDLSGTLIAIEGPDSSGRSTQIRLLSDWLEQNGFAVSEVGLKRSGLVAPALEAAQEGNVLSPRTMSLFYASDFYDQLENRIVPALRAGYVVLADRYIFTLMARDLARGADPEWVRSLYSMAIVPDAVFLIQVSTSKLIQRILNNRGTLDYWESGMDIGLSRDWYESFVKYQRRIRTEFRRLQEAFEFETINGNRSIMAIHRELKNQVLSVLEREQVPGRNDHGNGVTLAV